MIQLLYTNPLLNGEATFTVTAAEAGKVHHQERFDLKDDAACRAFARAVADAAGADDDTAATLRQRLAEQLEAVTPGPVLLNLDDVVEQQVEWLWQGVIAIGKVNVVYGDPGLGKSFITIDLASRTSTGSPFPGEPPGRREPGGVLLANAEDDIADTIKPRLRRAHADMKRIVSFQSVRRVSAQGQVREKAFTLEDVDDLRRAARQVPNLKLLSIDPISASLGDADSHNNAEVRGLLAPLAKLASDLRIAVVIITHLNKSHGSSALYRATGSLGLIAAARTGWLVVKDSADERRRMMLAAKNNLAADTTGFAYTIHDGALCWEEAPVVTRADEALAALAATSEGSKPGPKPQARNAAADWLRKLLRDGPVSAARVREEAEAAGLSFTGAVRRAAQQDLGITPYQTKDGWYWALPAEDEQSDEQRSYASTTRSSCSSASRPSQAHSLEGDMGALPARLVIDSARGCSSAAAALPAKELGPSQDPDEQDEQVLQGAGGEDA